MMKNTAKSIFNSEAFDKWYDRFIIGGVAAMGIAVAVAGVASIVEDKLPSNSASERSISAPTLK